MNYIDLFSGCGGFSLGAYMAGFKCKNHFYSEIDNFCINLFKQRFPDSVFLGDIEKIDFEKLKSDYSGDWILTGGFPCVDISVAGNQKGLIDENGKTRSGLWFDYFRAIRILRPRFAIIENVRQLLNSGLNTVLENLASIGYNAEWQIISAQEIGAPHKRERIWIVAYPTCLRFGNIQSYTVQDQKTGLSRCWLEQESFIENSNSKYGKIWGNVARKIQKNYKKWNFKNNASRPNKTLFQHRTKTGTSRMDDGISAELDRPGMPYKDTFKRHRLKALGNAIVPQIACYIFKQIQEVL